jgi:hypothetical protein
MVIALSALVTAGCYSEDLFDGTITILPTDQECVGTELVPGWDNIWPRGESRRRWTVTAQCRIEDPPADWQLDRQPLFDLEFETTEAPSRYFDDVGPDGWTTARPRATFSPELPEGHPCLAEDSLRLRREEGVDSWDTITLDYRGPCVVALLTITNNN